MGKLWKKKNNNKKKKIQRCRSASSYSSRLKKLAKEKIAEKEEIKEKGKKLKKLKKKVTHTFLHLSNFSWSHFSEFPAYICDFTCNFRSTNRKHRPTLQINQLSSLLKMKYFEKSYICNPVKRCIIKIIGRRRSGRGIHRVTESLISSTLRWRQISEKNWKINFTQKLKSH